MRGIGYPGPGRSGWWYHGQIQCANWFNRAEWPYRKRGSLVSSTLGGDRAFRSAVCVVSSPPPVHQRMVNWWRVKPNMKSPRSAEWFMMSLCLLLRPWPRRQHWRNFLFVRRAVTTGGTVEGGDLFWDTVF